MAKLTDESPMPFGKFKGTKMANVPDKYLLYIYENNMCSDPAVKFYIKTNLDVLRR